MNQALFEKYVKELKNKISLKMIPNKTEEQILYQNFKYFDLEGAGYCSLKDFIKTNEKIGVVLSHMQNFQEIFNYFDQEHSGVINYRDFCKQIFNFDNRSQMRSENNSRPLSVYSEQSRSIQNFQNNNNYNQKKIGPFFDKLVNILVENGGASPLISLYKEFKLLDLNNSNRLTIDDFIKIISENKINLSISDIQYLFHNYEFNKNGFFYYNEMFKDLKNVFWNNTRSKFVNDFYNQISNIKSNILLNDFKNMFNPKEHPFIKEINEQELIDEFNYVMDNYLTIKRMNIGNNKLCNKNEIEDFFKFYTFGIDSDECFMDILSNCFYVDNNNINNNMNNRNNDNDNISNYSNNYNNYNNNNQNSSPLKSRLMNKNKNNNYMDNQQPPRQKNTTNINNYVNPNQFQNNNNNLNNNNSQIEPIIYKLKNSLKKYGLKTFFGLYKQFKYYDNGSKMITKYDFAKVLKDFRLNLTVNEIEKIFDNFCDDAKKVLLYYHKFINALTSNDISQKRIEEIENIYDKINDYAASIGEKVTVDFLKSMYWPKENYFGLDEIQALNQFSDNLETFHEGIKELKNQIFSKQEFEEYYKIISFLVDDDEQFIQMIVNEWSKIFSPKNNNDNNYNYNNNFKHNNDNNIAELKNNLQCRGKGNERVIIPSKNDQDEDRSNFAYQEQRSQHSRSMTPGPYKLNKNFKNQNEFGNNNAQTSGDPLKKLKGKLIRRGIRGLMNLHKQFLFTCSDLGNISYVDFVKVLALQRLELTTNDYNTLFNRYCNEDNKQKCLNFPDFIRAFKIVLNDNRLNAVEKAFSCLDKDNTESLLIDDIKLKFNPKGHPDVVSGNKNEDEIITEFLDCFELNYNLLTTAENPETSNLVTFEEFANFYEYVSFLYDNDQDFIRLLENSWNN